jgi:NADH-quinone oxidoreductase subunit C
VSEPARPPAPPQSAPAGAPAQPTTEGPPSHPIVARLRDAVGDAIERDEQIRGQLVVRVGRDRLLEVCALLRDDPRLRFEHLADVTAVDYLLYDPEGGPPGEGRRPRFDVVYHLYSIARGHRLRLKVAVDEDDPVVPSLVGLWPAANWGERETYDMYGIRFSGHPELTRILMPDDWQGYPLRKDYPLIEEEIEFTTTLERLNERRPDPGRLGGPAR